MLKQTIVTGYWETRNGRKARVLCVDAPGSHPVKGYVEKAGGSCSQGWTADGAICLTDEADEDLIRPWVDRPVVDWSKERGWVKAIARDGDGSWWRFDGPPIQCAAKWDDASCRFSQRLHPSEYPRFNGNWKDSLCVRPEGGGK